MQSIQDDQCSITVFDFSYTKDLAGRLRRHKFIYLVWYDFVLLLIFPACVHVWYTSAAFMWPNWPIWIHMNMQSNAPIWMIYVHALTSMLQPVTKMRHSTHTALLTSNSNNKTVLISPWQWINSQTLNVNVIPCPWNLFPCGHVCQ